MPVSCIFQICTTPLEEKVNHSITLIHYCIQDCHLIWYVLHIFICLPLDVIEINPKYLTTVLNDQNHQICTQQCCTIDINCYVLNGDAINLSTTVHHSKIWDGHALMLLIPSRSLMFLVRGKGTCDITGLHTCCVHVFLVR